MSIGTGTAVSSNKNNKLASLQQGATATIFVAILLGLTSALLVLNAWHRQAEYTENRAQLTQNALRGVSELISQEITNLRHRVRLFGEREHELLTAMAVNPDQHYNHDTLSARVKSDFPDAFAVTLANASGEPIVTDFDGYILDICRRDIQHYANYHEPPGLFIHPNPFAYHIDIMVPVQLGKRGEHIFFISFKPDLFAKILASGELFGNEFLLLKKDRPGLIEVTTNGSRQLLGEEGLFLNPEQRSQITAQTSVKGTLWNLVSLPAGNTHSSYITQLCIELAVQLLIISIISLYMLRLLRRSQKTISAAQLQTLAAQQASQSKSSFLANMSHEIRTPLTAIIGFGETLLQSDQDKEERLSAVKTIINSSKHLLHLINDILDVSKIESGKLEIESLRFSAFDVLREVQELIEPQAQKKCLDISINFHYPLPVTIKNDSLRLKQILINLCSNAIKFTRKGHIIINVRADIKHEQICFEVEDTGKGMDEAACKRIFEAYTQADSSTTRLHGGTGLGLSLSKQLAQKLGGDITVTSNPGVGSNFMLTIATGEIDHALLIYNETQVPKRQTLSLDTPINLLSGRVLVAEDNQANQRLFKLIMEKMGVEVHIADNGRRAVELALTESYDLVFMDMLMPVMNGIEAISELRARAYKAPVIALTANATKEQKEQCIAAGCDGFATKPISRDDLYAVMSRYLKSSVKNAANDVPLASTLLEDDPDLIDLLHKFARELPKMQLELWRHFDHQDWQGFRDLIHQFKGVVGNYGYLVVSEHAAKIEFQCINKNTHEMQSLMHKLDDYIKRILAGIPDAHSDKKIINFPRQ